MGLQEKQAWAAVHQEIAPKLAQLKEATGAPIAVTINEGTFASVALIRRVPDSAVQLLAQGIEDLCQDTLAKEAVRGALKSVEIANEPVEHFALSFKKGVLKVVGNFDAEGSSGLQYPHANDYVTFLTENL